MTLAFHDPVPTTTNWALADEPLLDAALPDPPPPDAALPDPPVPEPVLPEPPEPAAPADAPEPEPPAPEEAAVELVVAVTFCPTMRVTDATIPSIGEASVAEFNAVCAVVTSA